MQDTLKIIGGVVVVVLIIDFLGFVAWIVSSQSPLDSFYVGSITAHTLKAIVSLF